MAKRRVGVEYPPSMLEPVRPGAASPDRTMCLPTFSHFVIVNKTSLSLSLGSLILASSFLFEDHLHLSPLPAATKMAQLIFRNQNYVSSAITFILYVYVHYVYHSVCLVSDLEGSDNVDPLKRDLFIVASCKSRSSHGLGDP
jgi:hypothetical protein